mmetsp:Transcript_14954/g.36191  ORF Transcript_14954/g.36191 Transcript_14954/m.36191 type:complete len:212 (-) Transcript_14954:1480-2115(-)
MSYPRQTLHPLVVPHVLLAAALVLQLDHGHHICAFHVVVVVHHVVRHLHEDAQTLRDAHVLADEPGLLTEPDPAVVVEARAPALVHGAVEEPVQLAGHAPGRHPHRHTGVFVVGDERRVHHDGLPLFEHPVVKQLDKRVRHGEHPGARCAAPAALSVVTVQHHRQSDQRLLPLVKAEFALRGHLLDVLLGIGRDSHRGVGLGVGLGVHLVR